MQRNAEECRGKRRRQVENGRKKSKKAQREVLNNNVVDK
jgi:hypothetical protein